MFNYVAILGILITVLVLGNTLPSFGQSDWQVYHVNATLLEGTGFKNQEFKIPYKITNGTIGEMKSDYNGPSLKISFANAKNNGMLVINLPTDFAEYYNRIYVGGVAVVVNSQETDYPLDFRSPFCFKTISIKFDSNSKDITMHPYELSSTQLSIGKPHVPPVYLSLNKNNYDPQIVTLSGCTDLKLDGKEVTLQILDLQGKTYKTISATPNINGTFLASITRGELHGNGTYIVNATYAEQSTTETFILPKFQQTNGSAVTPLKQFKSGTSAKDVKCNQDLVLVIKKSDNSPACVKPDTAQKLVERGWGTWTVSTAWFELKPIQCQSPWEQYYHKLYGNLTISARQNPIVTLTQYFKNNGVSLLEARLFFLPSEIPPPPCGQLSDDTYYFLVPQSDIQKMTELGYRMVQENQVCRPSDSTCHILPLEKTFVGMGGLVWQNN